MATNFIYNWAEHIHIFSTVLKYNKAKKSLRKLPKCAYKKLILSDTSVEKLVWAWRQ